SSTELSNKMESSHITIDLKVVREMRLQRSDKCLSAFSIEFFHLQDMPFQVSFFDKMRKRELLQHWRVQIAQSLEMTTLLNQRWRQDCIAEAKRWREPLAQGPHVDHALWL